MSDQMQEPAAASRGGVPVPGAPRAGAPAGPDDIGLPATAGAGVGDAEPEPEVGGAAAGQDEQDADDQGATPSPVPAAQATGDPRVDAALARLADLDQLPLAAQVTVFDDVHRLLQDALTASDAAPTPGAPPR